MEAAGMAVPLENDADAWRSSARRNDRYRKELSPLMRILYTAMKYDYGRPEQGLSFEHCNFYHSLLHMGHDIIYFDFMTLLQEHGKEFMNRRLAEVAKVEKPDLVFTVLFGDEFDPLTVRGLAQDQGITTVNWFCDDHWRFERYSRHWGPCFTWIVTTASSAVPKYRALGHRNVIKSQWGCNDFLYRKLDVPLKYDVTFIGQPHGNRKQMIETLQKSGIQVQVWGTGWESGRLSQEEMIRVFNQSRINLNLSNASVPDHTHTPTAPHETQLDQSVRSMLSRSLELTPFRDMINMTVKKLFPGAGGTSSLTDDSHPPLLAAHYGDQIKGRNFEIPGCGGFLLTGKADNLEQYYEIGKEVVSFTNVDDLIDKVRYYLAHDDERQAIAQSGYKRTIRDHTYTKRFTDIFQHMGLLTESTGNNTGQHARCGHTQQVR